MMGLYTILQDLICGSGSATVYSVVEAKCSTYVCTELTPLLIPELSLHILEIRKIIYSDSGVLFYELNINICSVHNKNQCASRWLFHSGDYCCK
jgi:hypothetical protein